MTNTIISPEPLFPIDLRLNLHSNEACQFDEHSQFWEVEHKQFAKGSFQGEITAIHTPLLQLATSYHSTGLTAQGAILAKTMMFAFFLPLQPCCCYYRGYGLEKNHIMTLECGKEIEFHTTHPSTILTVVVDAGLLKEQCLLLTGQSYEQLVLQERLQIKPDEYNKRVSHLVALLESLNRSSFVMSEDKAKLVEKEILATILLGVKAPMVPVNIPGRLYAAAIADNYIRKNIKNTISTNELCQVSGISERALRMGFQDRFGVSPKKYMQIIRLNGVRRDLLAKNSGKTVSDVAMEWGFYHLGRFSEQYMKMFDELPSKTKKCGK